MAASVIAFAVPDGATPRRPFDPDQIECRSVARGRLRLKMRPRDSDRALRAASALTPSNTATSITFNEILGTVLFEYDPRRYSERQFLEILFEHWRFSPSEIERVIESFPRRAQVRLEPRATSGFDPSLVDRWAIKSDTPGRLRLSHPFIGDYPAMVSRLDGTLLRLNGVMRFSFNAATASLLVFYDSDRLPRTTLWDSLRSAVRELAAELGQESLHRVPARLEGSTLRLALSTSTMGLGMGSVFVPALTPFALAGTTVAAAPILMSAIRSLVVERRLRVDVLDSVIVMLAIGYRRALPAAFMVWAVDLSYVLLNASSQAARRTLAELFGLPTQTTRLLQADGTVVECRVNQLNKGATIVVGAGEQIPVDGVVVYGEALVDQSALTGEHAPAEKGSGERVLAMSVVLTSRLHVRVERTGEETSASQMVRFIEQAAEHKVQLQSVTERFAERVVAPTLALGGVGYATVGPDAMMAVINADFGTGIRIAGPLAMFTSLSAAANHGILLKRGRVLEEIAGIDAVVFDKTGTVTEDVPAVHAVVSLDPRFDEDGLLCSIAGAERHVTHPIARAVLFETAARKLDLPAFAESDYQLGLGIQVMRDGRPFRVGSRRFLESVGVRIGAPVRRRLRDIHARGNTVILAAVDHRLVGLVELQVRPRPEAKRVVEWLRRQRGIDEIHLVSGDHEAPTRALAQQLTIDSYAAEVQPQDKARYVRDLQQRGLKVAMIGDGVNDTAGLSQADCSISLRGAADAATDIADIVLLDGGLARVELLFAVSDNLRRTTRWSFGLAIVPNSVLIAGALLGYFGLGTSLFLNNAFNLIAAINGLQAQRGLRPPDGVAG